MNSTQKTTVDIFKDVQVMEPLLIVISGPSAVGKDAVIEAIKSRNLDFSFVTTATSREPRAYEKNGVDYFFYTRDEFERMIKAGKFAEYALVYGDYKGVPVEQIEQAMQSHRDVLLRVDVAGAATLRAKFPKAVLIFLIPSNEQEWFSRFKTRNTETPQDLEIRRNTVRHEMEQLASFDYLVVNADGGLDRTVDTILQIIKVEHLRIHSNE